MPYIFWPVKAFEWVEDKKVIASYAPGLSYTVRIGNTKLDAKVAEWEKQGLVARTPPQSVDKKQSIWSWFFNGVEK